jgi:hypothetical protein
VWGLCIDSFSEQVTLLLFQYHLPKYCLFSNVLPLLFYERLIDTRKMKLMIACRPWNSAATKNVENTYVDIFRGSLFYRSDLFAYSFTSTTLSEFLRIFSKSWSSALQFCSSIVYCLIWISCVPIKLTFWDFDWNCIESIYQVWKK